MFSTKYMTDNLNLINSLCIKMEVIAISMNKQLDAVGVPRTPDDKRTWPYYLNISGKPHSANTAIYFTTLETNESVELTTTNLDKYTKSKSELLKYSDMFNTLCQTYIGQNLYIRGILNPIDIDVAINAEDGSILGHSPIFVEYNEVSLIHDLNKSSINFVDRWDIPEYSIIENLYASAVYSSLLNFLVKRLYNLRIRNIASYEIHSKYADDTLNSILAIGKHSSVLSRPSKLWLVKNISFISINIGKEYILDIINDNILKPHGVQIKETILEQDTPYDLSETNPVKSNTDFRGNVILEVDRGGRLDDRRPVLLEELNNSGFKVDALERDYSSSQQKFKTIENRMKNLYIGERTKFYTLDKNDTVSYSVYPKYEIMLAVMTLYYNHYDGLKKNTTLTLVTKGGISYSVSAKNIFSYLLYSIYKELGCSGDDIIPTMLPMSSLIKSDFNISEVLNRIDNNNPLYITVLTRLQEVILDPRAVTIKEFAKSQLKAQSIFGLCGARLRGPIQKASVLALMDCMTYDSRTVTQAMTLDKLLVESKLESIYPTYDRQNLHDVLITMTGILDYGLEDFNQVSLGLINIVKSLTSYTIYPIFNNSFSSEYLYLSKIGALEGSDISGIVSANIRCQVVPAVITDSIANDELLDMQVLNNDILFSYEVTNTSPTIAVDIPNASGISVETPILISSTY